MLWTAFLSQKSARLGAVCRTAVILILLLSSGILGAQLSSICSTGHYLDALTFSNLKSWRDAGWRIVLSSAAITVSCMLLTLTAALLPLQKFCRHHGRTMLICQPCLPGCLLRRSGRGLQEFQSRIPVVPQAEGLQDRSGNKEDPAKRSTGRTRPSAMPPRQRACRICEEKYCRHLCRGIFRRVDRPLQQVQWPHTKYRQFSRRIPVFRRIFQPYCKATFRGLRGQLTSSYQTEGGYYRTNDGLGQISGEKLRKKLAGNLVSVPQILEKNGFHTYFLSAHERKEQLNLMLETLEFGRVFGADDFYEGAQRLTDRPLFSVLKELVSGGRPRRPYFLGLYNIGTHLGQNSPDEKYGSWQKYPPQHDPQLR